MKNVSELIESRISANAFDTSRRLSDEQIEELVRLATLALHHSMRKTGK